jgi:Ca2+-binding RTX toxin-like protein
VRSAFGTYGLRVSTPRWVVGLIALVASAAALAIPSQASAASPSPTEDPFYVYDGSTPLADIAPGTVLKTRTGSTTFPALLQPVTWTQLLYRTRSQLGDPEATVTTVLNPPVALPAARVVSYQSFYDALTTRCEPSYMLNGGPANDLWTSEQNFFEVLLAQGYTVVTSDFEGQDPTFGTGPVYGYQTLDGIRAAFNSSTVGLPPATKVGLLGYSGGAIATEWATELAPSYASDVNSKLVGSAMGGVFVHPMHNLHYADGSQEWASVMPLALTGIAKAFQIDMTPYLSAEGAQIIDTVKADCIGEHDYPGLKWADLVKPQYADPTSVGPFVETANKLIMGNTNTPSVPLFIREGTDGPSEGTEPDPVYGPGDGVMLVKDVRSLATKYCDANVPIDYLEVPFGHGNTGAETLVDSIAWLQSRFLPGPAPDTCALIQDGNSLEPTAVTVKATCQGKPATIFGTSAGETLEGTAGDDVIAGLDGNDTINAGGGNDVVCGGTGEDTLNGNAGNDQLDGGSAADRLDGGSGADTVTYMGRGSVTVSIDGVANDGNSGDGTATTARDNVLTSVENLIGSDNSDTLTGSSAANVLYGSDGNDVLDGRAGPDRFSGGSGIDTVTYATRGSVKVSLDGVANDGNSGDGASPTARDYVSTTVENLIGGRGNDTLKGNSLANRLTGGLGADRLYGLAGSDTLIAKDGVKDTILDGGTGTDTGTFDAIDPARISVP